MVTDRHVSVKDPREVAASIYCLFLTPTGHDGLHSIDSIKTAAKSVCKIRLQSGGSTSSTASGFFCKLPLANTKERLVGLMTNNHVIGSDFLRNPEASFELIFEDEKHSAPIELTVKNDIAWFFTNPKVDVTFLQLLPETVTKIIGESHSVKPLEFSSRNVAENQELAVVQFPRGENQKIAFANVKEVSGLDFKHNVSTDHGSSGSPVFEVNSWHVVGIHKARDEVNEKDRFNWAVSANAVVDAIITEWNGKIESKKKRPKRNRNKAKSTSPDHVHDVGNDIENYYAPRMHKAAASGDLKGIKNLLVKFRKEFRPREGDELTLEEHLIDHRNVIDHERTPLIEAAINGHLPVVQYLVQNCDAEAYAQDSSKLLMSSAIHFAAEYGHFEIVKFLLQMEPELLEFPNGRGDTALSMACHGGHLNIAEYLVLNKKADVNVKGELGRTPLMRAAINGHLPIVKFLVERGRAKVDLRDNTRAKNTVMHLAAYFGHAHVIKYLLKIRPSLANVQNANKLLPSYYAELPLDKSETIALLKK